MDNNGRFLVHATLSHSRWSDSSRFWIRNACVGRPADSRISFQPKPHDFDKSPTDNFAIVLDFVNISRSVRDQADAKGEGYRAEALATSFSEVAERDTPLRQDYAFSVHHVSHNEYRSPHTTCYPVGRAMNIA